jgi:N12 class adenine-specific DNA methylase
MPKPLSDIVNGGRRPIPKAPMSASIMGERLSRVMGASIETERAYEREVDQFQAGQQKEIAAAHKQDVVRREARKSRLGEIMGQADQIRDSAMADYGRVTGRPTAKAANGRLAPAMDETTWAMEREKREAEAAKTVKAERDTERKAAHSAKVSAATLEEQRLAHQIDDPGLRVMSDTERAKLQEEVEMVRNTALAGLMPEVEKRVAARYPDKAERKAALAAVRMGQYDPEIVAEIERDMPDAFAGERDTRAKIAKDDELRARRDDLLQKRHAAAGRAMETKALDPLAPDPVAPPRDAFDGLARKKQFEARQMDIATRNQDLTARQQALRDGHEARVQEIQARFTQSVGGRVTRAQYALLEAERDAEIIRARAEMERGEMDLAPERARLRLDAEEFQREADAFNAAIAAPATPATTAPSPSVSPPAPATPDSPEAPAAADEGIRQVDPPIALPAGVQGTLAPRVEVSAVPGAASATVIARAKERAEGGDVYIRPDFAKPAAEGDTAPKIAPMSPEEVAEVSTRAVQVADKVRAAIETGAKDALAAVEAGAMTPEEGRVAYEAAQGAALAESSDDLQSVQTDTMRAVLDGRLAMGQAAGVMKSLGVDPAAFEAQVADHMDRSVKLREKEDQLVSIYADEPMKRASLLGETKDKIVNHLRSLVGLEGGAEFGKKFVPPQLLIAKDIFDAATGNDAGMAKAEEEIAKRNEAMTSAVDAALLARETETDALLADLDLDDDEIARMKLRAARQAFNTSEIGMEEVFAGFVADPARFAPLAGDYVATAMEFAPVIRAAQKAKNGEELSELDEMALENYIADAGREHTVLGMAADIVAMMPGFAGEIALTGGIGTAVKKGVGKGIRAELREEVLEGVTGWAARKAELQWAKRQTKTNLGKVALASVAGTTVQTLPAMQDMVATSILKKMTIPDLEGFDGDVQAWAAGPTMNFGKAFAQSSFDAWAEMMSEASGGAFGYMVPKGIKNRLAKASWVKAAQKLNASKPIAPLVKLARRGGFHGVGAEILEERVGDVIRGVGDAITDGYVGEEWQLPTAKQWAGEAIGMMIPGGAFAVANARASKAAKTANQQRFDRGHAPYAAFGDWTDPAGIADGINALVGRNADTVPFTGEEIAALEAELGPIAEMPSVRRLRELDSNLGAIMDRAAASDDIVALERATNARLAATAIYDDGQGHRSRAVEVLGTLIAQRDAARTAGALREMGDAAGASRITGAQKLAAGRPLAELTAEERAVWTAPLDEAGTPAMEEVNGTPIVTGPGLAALADVAGAPLAKALLPMPEAKARRLALNPERRPQWKPTNSPSSGSPGLFSSPAASELAANSLPGESAPATPAAKRTQWTARGERGTIVTLPADAAVSLDDAEAQLAALLPKGEMLSPDSVEPPSVRQGEPDADEIPGIETPDAEAEQTEPRPLDPIRAQVAELGLPPKQARNAEQILSVIEGLGGQDIFEAIEFTEEGDIGMVVVPSTMALRVNLKALAKDVRGPNHLVAAAIEEIIHAAALRSLDAEKVAELWRSTPGALKKLVLQAYRYDVAGGQDKLSDFAAGHEMIRMMVQDRAFRAQITEAQDLPASFGAKLLDLLRDLVAALRKHLSKLDKNLKRDYDAAVEEVIRTLEEFGVAVTRSTEAPPSQKERGKRGIDAEAGAAGADAKKITAPGDGAAPEAREPSLLGSTGTAYTTTGDAIEYQWAIVEAGDLVTSHSDSLAPNPAYDQALQGRQRDSAASEASITDIEGNTTFARLSDSSDTASGAPIVGPDLVVESGNGRSIALRRAWRKKRPNVAGYKADLVANAAKYGFEAGEVDALKAPVLVRIRRTEVDRAAFAEDANRPTVARLSERETALQDSKNLTPSMLEQLEVSAEGDLYTPANTQFFRQFFRLTVAAGELPGLVDKDGKMTQAGLNRVRNAVFVSAYGSDPRAERIFARLVEEVDPEQRNVVNALVAAAPELARHRAGVEAGSVFATGFPEDLLAAADEFLQSRQEGQSVEEWLGQGRMFEGPLPATVEALVRFFGSNVRSARRLALGVRNTIALLERAGNPQEGGLFGDAAPPDLGAILEDALGRDALVGSEVQGEMALAMGAPPAREIDAKVGTFLNRSISRFFANIEETPGEFSVLAEQVEAIARKAYTGNPAFSVGNALRVALPRTPESVPRETAMEIGRLTARRILDSQQADAAFQQSVRAAAAERDGEWWPIAGPVKKFARTAEKAMQEWADNNADAPGSFSAAQAVASMKDLVRATIIVQDAADFDAALEAVGRHFTVSRHKPRWDTPLPTAYADHLLNVENESGISEIQLHIPEVFVAKEGWFPALPEAYRPANPLARYGHSYYEEQRMLTSTIPGAKERSAALDELQAALYGSALRAHYERTNSRPGAIWLNRFLTDSQSAGESFRLTGFGDPSDPSGLIPKISLPTMTAGNSESPRSAGSAPAGAFNVTDSLTRKDTPRDSAPQENIEAARKKMFAVVGDEALSDRLYDALPDARGGKVIGTDIARELLPEYAADREGKIWWTKATSKPASAYTKRRLNRELSNRGDREVFLLTAGGVAAGKSTAVSDEVVASADLVYDTTMRDPKRGIELIEQALEHGWRVEINYVQRPPRLAVGGAIYRAQNAGRWGPIWEIPETHVEAQRSIVEVARHFEGEGRVAINLWYNASTVFPPPAPTRISISDIAEGGPLAYVSADESTQLDRAGEAGQAGSLSQGLRDESVEAAREVLAEAVASGQYEPRILRLVAQGDPAMEELAGLSALAMGAPAYQAEQLDLLGYQAPDGGIRRIPRTKPARTNSAAASPLTFQGNLFDWQPPAQSDTVANDGNGNRAGTGRVGSRRPGPEAGGSGLAENPQRPQDAGASLGDLFAWGGGPTALPAGTDGSGLGGVGGIRGDQRPQRGEGDAATLEADGAGDRGDGDGAAGDRPVGDAAGGLPGADPGLIPLAPLAKPMRETAPGEKPILERPTDPAARNFVLPDGFEPSPGGAKARIEANFSAIKLLRALEEEGREATPEEKLVLVRYTGWGSFKEPFAKITYDDAKRRVENVTRSHGEDWFTRDYEEKTYSYSSYGRQNYRPEEAFFEAQRWLNNHAELHERLVEELTPQEFDAAFMSIMNAHFTAAPIVDAVWDMARKAGFRGGKAMEPAAGVGHFIGRTPSDLADRTEWNAVELDEITAKILGKLYPEARVNSNRPDPTRIIGGQGFESARIPNNSLDLMISNVPFDADGPGQSVSEFGIQFNLHNYFFARALSKVKPGGLVVFITTHNSMDASIDQRKWLAEHSEFVHAVRLPSTAFKKTAGTEVVTDIIVLRKPDGSGVAPVNESWTLTTDVGAEEVEQTVALSEKGKDLTKKAIGEGLFKIPHDWQALDPEIAPLWDAWAVKRPGSGPLHKALVDALAERVEAAPGKRERWNRRERVRLRFNATIRANEFFRRNPEAVVGTHSLAGSMYGENEYTVKPPEGGEEAYYAAVDRAVALTPEVGQALDTGEEIEVASDTGDREGSFVERDGKFFQVFRKTLLPMEWTPSQEALYRSWAKALIAVENLLILEQSPETDAARLDAARATLNRYFDEHVAQYGHPADPNNRRNKHRHLIADSAGYALIQSLEEPVKDVGLDGKVSYTYEKSPIMERRVLKPLIEPTSAESAVDAYKYSMAYRGRIDSGFVARLLGITEEEAKSRLLNESYVYEDPITGLLVDADEYLSGNVVTKFLAAEAAAKEDSRYERNAAALAEVRPPIKPASKISFQVGAVWIPNEVYDAFAREFLQIGDARTRVEDQVKQFLGSGGSRDWGTDDISAAKIFKSLIEDKAIAIYHGKGDDRVFSPSATEAARAKAEEMRREFGNWVRSSPVEVNGRVVAEVSAEEYNRTINVLRPPTFIGEWVDLPDQSGEINLTPHRKAVIARFLTQGYGMMAHGVGSGKTYALIALAHEMKRLGKANKIVIVAMNPTVEQFAASYKKAYPQARLLIANPKGNFDKSRRAQFYSQMATGDFDAIILPHSTLKQIPHTPAAIQAHFDLQLEELMETLRAVVASGDKKAANTIRAAIKKLREKMKARMDKAEKNRDEGAIEWEKMGIDALLVDEAHAFKNAPVITKMKRIKNLPTGEASDNALSMMMKAVDVQKRRAGKNVFFATGTPITNTMGEAYVMLRYLAPESLKDLGIQNFDDFARTFAITEENPEATWRGKVQMTTRLTDFVNGQALVNLIRSVFDVAIGNEKLGLDVPKVKGGGPRQILVKQTPVTQVINDWILDIVDSYEALDPKDIKEDKQLGAIPIVTMQAGLAAATDPRLIDPNAPDDPNSKVNVMIEDIMRIYDAGKERKITQAIFSDLRKPFKTKLLIDKGMVDGLPYGGEAMGYEEDGKERDSDSEDDDSDDTDNRFDLFENIKTKLVARGVDPSEIWWPTNEKQEKLAEQFAAVNEGSIRIIMGGTAKIGTGVNFQELLGAVHHLSPPRDMKPAMLEQRNGRIIRQGNNHAEWAHNAFVAVVEQASGQKFEGKNPKKRRQAAEAWLRENIEAGAPPVLPIENDPTRMSATEGMDPRVKPRRWPVATAWAEAEAAAAQFDIEIIEYAIENSTDSSIFSMMAAKQGMIGKVMSDSVAEDEFSDPAAGVKIAMAEFAAKIIGDADLVRMIELERSVQTLRIKAKNHAAAIANKRFDIREAKSRLEWIERAEAARAKLPPNIENLFDDPKALPVWTYGQFTFDPYDKKKETPFIGSLERWIADLRSAPRSYTLTVGPLEFTVQKYESIKRDGPADGRVSIVVGDQFLGTSIIADRGFSSAKGLVQQVHTLVRDVAFQSRADEATKARILRDLPEMEAEDLDAPFSGEAELRALESEYVEVRAAVTEGLEAKAAERHARRMERLNRGESAEATPGEAAIIAMVSNAAGVIAAPKVERIWAEMQERREPVGREESLAMGAPSRPHLDMEADWSTWPLAEVVMDIAGIPAKSKLRPMMRKKPKMAPLVKHAGGQQALERALANAGLAMGAWHGTPHKVDRFSVEKIGTGEGAQAYGWGLYFAEAEGIARYYRDSLSSVNLNAPRWKWNQRERYSEVDDVLNEDQGWNTKEELVASLRQRADSVEDEWGDPQPQNDYALAADLIESGGIEIVERPAGNLYRVEINADPETEFLDWDKPLSQQSEKVRFGAQWLNAEVGETGKEVYLRIVSDLAKVYPRTLRQKLAKEASRLLLRQGIKGIRYLDGSSRAAGEGSRNFVVFDESIVEILEENGQPVSKAEREETLAMGRSQGVDGSRVTGDNRGIETESSASGEDIAPGSQADIEARARNPITVYRAGDADEVGVKPYASFALDRDTAEAYLDNPGFGGETLREIRVDAGNALDIRGNRPFVTLAQSIGMDEEMARDWMSSGYLYPWEESRRVREALEESGYDSLIYTDDFPSGASSIIFLKEPTIIPNESPAPESSPGALALGRPSSPRDSSDSFDAAAIRDILDYYDRRLPSPAAMDERRRTMGQRTAGAEPAGAPLNLDGTPDRVDVRREIAAVRDVQLDRMKSQTHEQWVAEAKRLIAADYDGVVRALLEHAREGEPLPNPALVKAAQIIIPRVWRHAKSTGDKADMRDAQALTYAYLEGGTRASYVLGARRDMFKTQAERHVDLLSGVIARLPAGVRKRAEAAPTPSGKRRQIEKLKGDLDRARATATGKSAEVEALEARIEKAKVAGKAGLAEIARLNTELQNAKAMHNATAANARKEIDRLEAEQAANKAEIAKLAKQLENVKRLHNASVANAKASIQRLGAALGEARRQKDRAEILGEAHEQRLAKVEATLRDMGLTLHDIFSHQAVVRLRGSEIVARVVEENFSAPQRAAIRFSLPPEGLSPREVAKRTGIKRDAIPALMGQFRKKMEARFLELAKNGLTLNDFMAAETAGGMFDVTGRIGEQGETLGLGQSRVGDAEAAAAAKEMMEALFGGVEVQDRRPGARKPNRVPFDMENKVHVAQVAQVLRAATDSSGVDMAFEFWINNILSGPQTHAVNITGNSLAMAMEYGMQRWLEATWNLAVGDPKGATFGEYRHIFSGLGPIWSKAFSQASTAWLSEASYLADEFLLDPAAVSGSRDKTETIRRAIPDRLGKLGTTGAKDLPSAVVDFAKGKGWKGASVGKTVRIPGRALMFMDTLFKSVVVQTEVSGQAYRLGRAQGLQGDALESFMRSEVNRPGSESYQAAFAVGEEMTFTQALRGADEGGGMFEQMVKKLQDARHPDSTLSPLAAAIIGFFFPFIQTPFNIFKAGLRRTPFGLAGIAAYLLRHGFAGWKNGVPHIDRGKARMVRDMTDQTISMLVTWLLLGFTEGDDDDDEKTFLVTGSRPYGVDSTGERQLIDRAEGGAMTIRIGRADDPDAVRIDYSRLEPVSTVLGSVADAIRSIKRMQNGASKGDEIAKLHSYVLAQATDKTFLQGIVKIGEIMEPGRSSTSAAARTVAQAIVPNLIRQPLRLLDDYARDSRTAPWYYHALPIGAFAEPRADLYGEPMRKGKTPLAPLLGPLDRAARIAIDTGLQPAEVRHPADVALANWNRRHTDKGDQYFPPGNSITSFKDLAGQGQKLTATQLAEVERIGGLRLRVELARSLTPAEVRNPTEETIKKIRDARGRVFSAARNEVAKRPAPAKKPVRSLSDLMGFAPRQ